MLQYEKYKKMYKGREDEDEDVKSYWIILMKRNDTGS
jgi:hypothetical protein